MGRGRDQGSRLIGNQADRRALSLPAAQTRDNMKETPMKGIVAWLLGVPIVVIVLFYVTGIF
jgi:hypothetical protein